MRIAFWNIRGFNEPLKKKEVFQMSRKENLDLFCIAEAKIISDSLENSLTQFKDDWYWTYNDLFGKVRLIVFWKKDRLDFDLVSLNPQSITCQTRFKDGSSSVKVTFVHAASRENHRRILWENLRHISTPTPWLIIGDFNATLDVNERKGERSIMRPDPKFRQLVKDLELRDLPSTGCFFYLVKQKG